MIIAIVFIIVRPKEKDQPRETAKKVSGISFLDAPSKSKTIVDVNILEDIKIARKILERERAGYTTVDEKKWGYAGKGKKHFWIEKKLKSYNVLLAARDVNSKIIRIVKFNSDGNSVTKGFIVNYDQSNGVNTEFNIVYPEGYVVLAIKRVVSKGNGFEEVVYTPFTEELNIPEIRKMGLAYLNSNLQKAQTDLRESKVISKARSGLVSDAIPTDVALILSIIEHIDPAKIKTVPIEQLINRVLVIVGLNKEQAFRYSISKAGARGLFQFIPLTYSKIIVQYPKANLVRDFKTGMDNHSNAAMASLLLLDSDLSVLSKNARQILWKDVREAGRYLASSYNCGAGRTEILMDKYGKLWTKKVPLETVSYLKKFDLTWEVLSRG
jgi:hypothetical protein